MGLKINLAQASNLSHSNESSDNPTASKLQTNTDAQNNEAIQFLTNQAAAKTASINNIDNDNTKKTVAGFLKEIRQQQPFDEAGLSKKEIKVYLELKKRTSQITVADYDTATWRAIFKKAGYSILTKEEIAMAVQAMKNTGWTATDGGFSLSNLRRVDAQPGAMFVRTNEATIEKAKRAGQAVLQYREYKAKQSDANQEGNRSKTNQMLLDPLRLGGNVPFRWTERILNTPRDILRQIDQGEIMPGTATAKWIGGKIGEQITGQPAPPIPTISESVEQLTGAKLPTIPEIELP